MTEDPEEVHPEHGGAPGLRVEEMSAKIAVDRQHDLRRRQRTDGEQNQDGHHEIEPGQQRHSPEVHPRTAHAENRGQHIDRCADAADAGNQQCHRPEVGAVSARECLRGQRRVREPSHVRSVARAIQATGAQQTEVQQEPAERCQPETERIQPRERHVARADHQWQQVVGEPEHDGHGHEKDHRGPMHGEHAVEDLRRHEVVVRNHELDAHDRRFNPADDEKDQRVKDVEDAQPLVIDGRHPFVKHLDPWTVDDLCGWNGNRVG